MTNLDDLFMICPYATTQKIVSGKWALIILQRLSDETMRFNELQRALPEMTQTTLTRQLKTLEDYGLIHREVYPQIPPKVEYSLTDIGLEFKAVLKEMERWGDKYIALNKKEQL